MAFQDVNTSNTKKATAMKVGEAITGYVIRIEESSKHEGQMNLVIQDDNTGETYLLFSAGNLRYIIADGKVKEGLLTRVERIADKNVKGKMSTQFRVQQDPESSISTAQSTVLTDADKKEESSFNALGGQPSPGDVRGAVERNIKKQADKLAASMSPRK